MRSHTDRFVIVFNGEIYNFRSLRSELSAAGVEFAGFSDTEVMLACFERFGVEEAVKRFSGMFAFAVWDAELDQLWLCRDRLGEKPLYFGVSNDSCYFASELKSILAAGVFSREIDPIAVACVLRFGYIPAPRTIYAALTKLHPGELLRVSRSESGALSSTATRYWDAADVAETAAREPRTARLAEASAAIEAELRMVIGEQMLADVPVGAFLSGGIDSSLVVALMQEQSTRPVRTFTVAFNEAAHDESQFAAAISQHLGTTHTEIRLPASDALKALEFLPWMYDEPFADSSQLPTWLVSRVTREHVTVALSGDGGDELFGGYSQYLGRDSVGDLVASIPSPMRRPLARMLRAAPTSIVNALIARAGGGSWAASTRERVARGLEFDSGQTLYEDRQARWIRPQDVMTESWARRVPERLNHPATWSRTLASPENAMAYDAQTYLPGDILVKVDRAAMANSLETRAPLLDHRIFEAAWSLPVDVKIERGVGKRVLRHILEKHVPKSLFDRPKQGFSIPLARWLREDLRSWVEDLLITAEHPNSPLHAPTLRGIWNDHVSGREDHSERLWSALVLLQWLREHR